MNEANVGKNFASNNFIITYNHGKEVTAELDHKFIEVIT